MSAVCARSLPGIPDVKQGDDIAGLILTAIGAQPEACALADGEVVVIAHKIVSKAEGAVVDVGTVRVSGPARELAGRVSAQSAQAKDPRALQVVLEQSAEVVRAERGVVVARTRHGFVCANAGVDASNASQPQTLIVLPTDPDASARRIRAALRRLTGARVAVVIADSFGRAWRHGQCDVAIGCAGLTPLDDWSGRTDGAGRPLTATLLAIADSAAALADLARAKDSREPVVIVAGLERFVTDDDGPGAKALVRPREQDLFR